MKLIQQNGLRYYQFDTFQGKAVEHGLFTRHGGVSPKPWDALNLGGTTGDDTPNVVENRRRMFEVFSREVDSIHDVWQVHGCDVKVVNAPRPLNQPHERADAMISNCAEISLVMRFADCVPILFFDPVKEVVGIAHAGWQGTVKQIGAWTVRKMQDTYACDPADILAGIGPSIGPDHYEVGPDVIDAVRTQLPEIAHQVLIPVGKRLHLNLWETNRLILEQAGVKSIEVAEICTACHTDDWYSHRAEHGKTGRYGALIALKRDGAKNG